MHICFVGSQYPPEMQYDGGSTLRYISASLLAERGHKVTVITVTREKTQSQRMEKGVWVWRLPEPRYRTTLPEDLRHNWQVWRAVQQVQPEIVQVHESGAEGFLLAKLGRGNFKLVTRMSSYTTLTNARYSYPFSIRKRVLSYMARQQTLASHALYAPTFNLARQIEHDIKLKPGSVQHIPNGLLLNEMQIFRQATPILKIDSPYIVYYGRVEEDKGAAYLAQALPAVWEKIPSLKVVLIGLYSNYKLEGQPARTYIEKLAGKYATNLIFTGHLPRHEALAIVARAKLAVLPTIWEAFSYACAEAIALGVPVVTTIDSGGPAEIVAGVNDSQVEPNSIPAGWLVPRRNAQALGAAMLEALTDPILLAQVKKNALERAKRYAAPQMIDKMLALYQQL